MVKSGCLQHNTLYALYHLSSLYKAQASFPSIRSLLGFSLFPFYTTKNLRFMVSDFEELGIYQLSREVAKQVYKITRTGEFKYDTRFVQQMKASSGSISDNIAEGFERQGNKEFLQFLYIAKGSCGEFRSQINRAYDVEFISKETYDQMYADCRRLGAGILNFIKSVKSFEPRVQSTKANPLYLLYLLYTLSFLCLRIHVQSSQPLW